MLTEINDENARRLLSENKVARLGCVLESGEPYIVPINYFYRDDAIYFHSLEGLKLDALRSNPKSCVQVEAVKNSFVWQSVTAFAGLVLAWREEGLGGAIVVGSILGIYLIYGWLLNGSINQGWVFLPFLVPGVLFVAYRILSIPHLSPQSRKF